MNHTPLETRKLGCTDVDVTTLGFGCAPLGNLRTPVSDVDARAALAAAWAEGVRTFDTAPLYGLGLSERRTGAFLREQQSADVVLSTKVGRLLLPGAEPDDMWADALPFHAIYDYSRAGVMRSVEESLERLGLSRVEILLVHDIGARTHGAEAHPGLLRRALDGAFPALHELRAEGRVGAIGVGVNEVEVVSQILAQTDLDCVMLASRYTLFDQEAAVALLPLCVARGVSVIVAAPFNSGLLVDPTAATATYEYAPATPDVIARARQLARVCASHGTALPAAALQFPLRHPAVASVVPGCRSAREVHECATWFHTPIPEALWDDLAGEQLVRV